MKTNSLKMKFIALLIISIISIFMDIDAWQPKWVGTILALMLVYFIPGYCLKVLMLPDLMGNIILARLAFSTVLSISLSTVLALFLYQLDIGLDNSGIIPGYGIVCAGLVMLVIWKNRVYVVSNRKFNFKSLALSFVDYVYILAGVILVVTAFSIFYSSIERINNPKNYYTEFFVSSEKDISMEMEEGIGLMKIPIELNNFEGSSKTYGIFLVIDDVPSGVIYPINLANDQYWVDYVEFHLKEGAKSVEIILLMEGEDANPYRSLLLDIEKFSVP